MARKLTGVKTVLEHLCQERIRIGQRREAPTEIAGRKYAKLATEPARGASVVSH
jgi:hypothetical protein